MHGKDLHIVGRAALLRRPRIQGRAAALPCQEGKDFCQDIRGFSLLTQRKSVEKLEKKDELLG
jgi:hypothetical protein